MTTVAAPPPAATTPAPAPASGSAPFRPSRIALRAIAAVIVFIASVFPVYWMVSTSFQPNSQIRGSEIHFWPENFTLENYAAVIGGDTRAPFLPALGNSIAVTVLTVFVSLIFAFLAALAVTRFRFRSRAGFIIAILFVQMIPAEAMIISIFRLIDGWHLLNTIIGLSVVYIATVLPFTIWTLRGFVNGVPAELEEAAMIDGLSRSGAFWRVTFPLLAPGLVATGIFGFIQAWNEFIFALVLNPRPEAMTLPVWLRTFLDRTAESTGPTDGRVHLVAIPVVVFFLFVQGRMTGGLVAGAVKG